MSEEKDPYNRGGYIAFLFSMVFSFVFFFYVSYIHPPVDLKEIPESTGEGQMSLAQMVRENQEPWKEVEFMAEQGKKVYALNCASCHGNAGLGDGPGGAALPVKPRNLVKGDWTKGGSSIALYKTLTDGIAGSAMVGFKHISPSDRWAMVQYIRAITENKEKDNDQELAAFGATAE